MSEAREALAAATRSQRAWLPPRWFVLLFWHGHRALVRVTRGRLGLWRPKPHGWGALRLTTTGRRTGRPRQVVVGYFEDGRNLITMAMNGWGVAEPAWWLNLQAHPGATAQTRDGARQVRARRAQGDERERLWSRWAEIDKNLGGYAARRPTETAVVVLEPPDTADPAAGPVPAERAAASPEGRRAMRSRDVRATTAGLLFIAATATSLVATAFRGSLLEGPGFLATVALHQNRLLAAALFQLLAAFTSAAIAVALYPVLRQHAAGMALGAVAFRLIEGVFYALSAAGTLILVSLSGQLTAGASAHASADLVRDLRDSASCVGVLAFYTGATLYYLVFYRSQLIPRWLSVWGLAGTVLGLAAGLLVLFQSIALLSGTQVVLNLPIAVQEMVLAVWLIVKGFSPKAKAPTAAELRPALTRQHAEQP